MEVCANAYFRGAKNLARCKRRRASNCHRSMTTADFDFLYALRHQSEALVECARILEQTPPEFEWAWRRARLEHFRAMQALEAGEPTAARSRFALGAAAANQAQQLDFSRVEGAFWSGVCELEAARLGGKLALMATLTRAQKAIGRAARSDEEFHFAGPLRVLGRITHHKPLVLGGLLDGALAFYERALQIAPRNSTNQLYFADALLADRQPVRAREALRAVLESDSRDWKWETARDQKVAREWLGSRFD